MLEFGQQQQLRQEQVMTQWMHLAVKILQMNTLDVEQYIRQMAMENPILELESAEPSEESEAAQRVKKLEWLDSVDESNSFRYMLRPDHEDRETTLYRKPQENLADELLFQLPGFGLRAERERIVRYLILNLDDNGYLKMNDERLLEQLGCTEEELDAARSVLWRMDPAGVGARDLRECLLIQARRQDPPCPELVALIEQHLDTLAKNRLDRIARDLKISMDRVRELREQLMTLNPKPGNGYSAYNAVPYIQPDLFVVHFEDRFEVIYNDFRQPRVVKNPYYQSLGGEVSGEAAAYIREKTQQADMLISCINQRRETILRCAQVILERQLAFFRNGPGHLAPMTLADVAEGIEMHPSTVSRAVSGKYLQCQWGVWRIGDLFSHSAGKAAADASQDMVRERLRALIEAEDPAKPLSDQKLADQLGAEGMEIARRTVAKYRDQLGIPPASGRRQWE